MNLIPRFIGVDDATRCPIIGSLFITAIAIDDLNIFEKEPFTSLPIQDSKTLTHKQIKEIYIKTRNFVKYSVWQIFPWDMENFNLNDLEAKGMLLAMNRFFRFWKAEKIFIDNFDRNKDKFIQRVKKVAWANLKPYLTDFSNWVVEHYADEKYKIVSLAGIYSKYFSNREYELLKEIYGDFGSGNPNDKKTLEFIKKNPSCPIIRKKWATYKRLMGEGKDDEGNPKKKSESSGKRILSLPFATTFYHLSQSHCPHVPLFSNLGSE